MTDGPAPQADKTMPLPDDAVRRFRDGLAAAEAADEIEPTGMALSTLGERGGLSSRMVLMKDFSAAGLVFYTNLESIKGRQLAANRDAALLFHWKAIEQQVRVEGLAEAVDDATADAYFASRPRGSQLGAWASEQSRPLPGRGALLKRVAAAEARYLGRPVPRPPYWSGFLVRPAMIEFWYGRKSRLHERFRYTLADGDWRLDRLYP